MKKSAGILLYKQKDAMLNFLLVHPGGPFWASKDLGSWSIPKGEFDDSENPLDAAIREFSEETGTRLQGNFMALSPVKLRSGKMVYAWALETDFDTATLASNMFNIEWPPKSGKTLAIPEVDKAQWFALEAALEKINPAQSGFITELLLKLKP